MGLIVEKYFGVVQIQGFPRTCYRQFGVPPGGAFDLESLRLANALVSNPPEAPAYELSMASAQFRAEDDLIVAIVGQTGRRQAIQKGESFSVSPDPHCARVYVATSPQTQLKPKSLAEPPASTNPRIIRYVPFGEGTFTKLDRFSVSREANRVGIRLVSKLDEHKIELPSEPATPGVIQWTPSGQLIILGPDGPTIGGYPKIGVIIAADMNRVGQLRPDDSIEFHPVTVGEARQIARDEEQRIQTLEVQIRLSS